MTSMTSLYLDVLLHSHDDCNYSAYEAVIAFRLNTTYCTVLHCTALHCTLLYCTALYCTALLGTPLNCTLLYYSIVFEGIDASAAMAVTRIVRDLARTGVTCVAVIHQPRGEIFSLIDDFILLQ